MNKKTITLVMMLLLSVMGVKADVIFPASSEYYSEPAAGTYYLYNVDESKFMANTDLIEIPMEITLEDAGDGRFYLTPANGGYFKIGKSGSQYLWNNNKGSGSVFKWGFTQDGTKTYKLGVTITEDSWSEASYEFTKGASYYLNTKWSITKNDENTPNKWVLITPSNYRAYVATLKTNAIPSTYYSALPTEKNATITGYLYDVVNQKFIDTNYWGNWGNNQPNANKTTITKVEGGYLISGNSASTYQKYGTANETNVWNNGGAEDAVSKWEASKEEGDESNIYIFKNSTGQGSNGTGLYLYSRGTATRYVTNAIFASASYSQWALITEANWYNYLATTTATIPSTYYTATPAVGTYYLYNIQHNSFLRRGDEAYPGMQRTPAAITLTSKGGSAYSLQFSDGTYLKTGSAVGRYVWTDDETGDFAWTFESFHDATNLFTLKCPLSETDYYLCANGTGTRDVYGGTSPETNNTKYAWALISADDYATWQNSFVLDEATGYSATKDIYNVNPTMNRTMTANVWNTLVVPFDMAIPSGWTVKEPTAFEGTTLTFGDASSIVHGKPYIVKPTSDVTSFSATGVTLCKDLQKTSVSENALTMTGTYTAGTVPTDSYIIGIKGGASALYKVNSTVSIKPFRAYFTVADPSGARINLNFGDEATGINMVNGSGLKVNGYYNLQGQRVENPKKGLYIVNGKKVMVK